jgi:hypothetical protein
MEIQYFMIIFAPKIFHIPDQLPDQCKFNIVD